MNPNFWKDKSVLITGNTGFKGSWLCLWLENVGSNVIGFSKDMPTKPCFFEDAKVEKDMELIVGDVRNYNEFERVVKKHEPEIIIHMAAQSIVQTSYQNPIETYSTNVMGTVNLLEITRKTKIPKIIVNVTSDKCYKNFDQTKPFTESDPMGGFDPYSSSKGCAELITESYRNSFFNLEEFEKHKIAIATVRAGNIIGGGDWSPYRLIPDIIRGIIKKQEIKIRNQNAIRHWQHVFDPLNGYLMLAEKLWDNGLEFSSGWNFGPTNEEGKNVLWILEKFNEFGTNKITWKKDEMISNYESNYLTLDSQKAIQELNWKSKLSLEESIKLTIEWYQLFLNKEDMKEKSLEQIKNFMKLN